ncbi:hypothetical protein VTH82DRAFT_6899 [Thermothelomyces myriococcoides]
MPSTRPTLPPSCDSNFSSLLSEPATARDEGSTSTATSQPSSGVRAPTDAHNHSIERFQAQHPVSDDATPHGRILGLPPHPHPDALVALYETRAARVIASFDAAFGSGDGDAQSADSGPPVSSARL